MDGQIKQLCKDLARVEHLLGGKKLKAKHKEALKRKYWLRQKGFKRVAEEIKQRLISKTSKMKRYQSRI